ncbi:Vitamin K epoxide reductase complex subunit 1-like protein 1 [Phytophthora boehmeriae]|uniref:Vitamin K epoxide reductase complex subunit 1-like protein 1 n=1 Tax=Phytophthora boehmeriae TaxID=109152 RepID=A0A8T1VEF6_9STRA|nr:Vitamin K epoxide reductase complex subunit 1-like protein 1 [Phytophthora boehmeriae]
MDGKGPLVETDEVLNLMGQQALYDIENVLVNEFRETKTLIYVNGHLWILLSAVESLRMNSKKEGRISMTRRAVLKKVFKNEYLMPKSGRFQVKKWTGRAHVPDLYVQLSRALCDRVFFDTVWGKTGEQHLEDNRLMSTAQERLSELSTTARSIRRRMSALGVLGVAISLYAIYIKQQKLLLDEDYQALCDSESFSCSQVLTSEYSSLLSYWGLVDKYSTLDWSNAQLGVVVYALFGLCPMVKQAPYHAHFYVFASGCATVVMLYLAYILAFVLRDLCMVCVATYFVTAALAWNSLALLGAIRRVEQVIHTARRDCVTLQDTVSHMTAARYG